MLNFCNLMLSLCTDILTLCSLIPGLWTDTLDLSNPPLKSRT